MVLKGKNNHKKQQIQFKAQKFDQGHKKGEIRIRNQATQDINFQQRLDSSSHAVKGPKIHQNF